MSFDNFFEEVKMNLITKRKKRIYKDGNLDMLKSMSVEEQTLL